MHLDTTARRYRLLSVLGEGGFGKVYHAEMMGTGGFVQQVALKVVNPKQPQADEALRRLRDEARILGHLRHRAVVRAHGLTRLEPGWTIVLEYIEGVDCGTLIDNLDIPLRVVVEIAEEVASALVSAWNAPGSGGAPLRLIHRDIKPGNIRITSDGQVKVLDFGAARAQFDAREASTRSYILGSYHYMAPERFQGRDGPAVDVYALGLVLAQLVTRQAAPAQVFGELEHGRMVERVATDVEARIQEESPEQVAALQPLAALIASMLAFDPDHRPSADDVERTCRDLRGWVDGPFLRDWAPRHVPRLIRHPEECEGDAFSGSILIELGADDEKGHAQVPAIGAPPGVAPTPPPRAESRWVAPVAIVAAVLLGLGGVAAGVALGRLDTGGPPVAAGVADTLPPVPPSPVGAASTQPAVALAIEPAPAPPPQSQGGVSSSKTDRASAPRSTPSSKVAAPAPVVASAAPVETPPPVVMTEVTVSGDATEVFATVSGSRTALPGRVSPGRHRVSAAFPSGERWAGEIEFGGDAMTLSCTTDFGKCKKR